MFLALVLAAAPAAPVPLAPPPKPVGDWKSALKTVPWASGIERSGARGSVDAARAAGLAADFQPGPNGLGEGTFSFQKKDGPKVTVDGHVETPAVVCKDVLYVARFNPTANGCAVAAYDLTTGKRAWEKTLAGTGSAPVERNECRNRVAMTVKKHPTENHFALVIVGNEGTLWYVEVLDLNTGKQLGHVLWRVEL
jgi:hypothetical protein